MRRILRFAPVLAFVTSLLPGLSGAATIMTGFDLFMTLPPTSFNGVSFFGFAPGTFDFGSGPVAIGNTDTIVQRLAIASCAVPPCYDVVDTELVMLSLVSTVPIGGSFLYVTLQS